MQEIRLHGRGGQGVVKAAEVIVSAAVSAGLFGISVPYFGFERQGAPVAAFVRLDESPIRPKTQVYRPDCVIVLDEKLLTAANVFQGVKPGATLIINTTKEPGEIPVPYGISVVAAIDASGIALRTLGAVRPNTAILGAFAATTGWVDVNILAAHAAAVFGEQNRTALLAGASEVKIDRKDLHQVSETETTFSEGGGLEPSLAALEKPPIYTLTGNFAAPVGVDLYVVHTGDWRISRPQIDRQLCNNCGVCFLYCPTGSVKFSQKQYFIDLEFCKGCGICACECPCKSISMIQEEGEAVGNY